MKNYVKSKLVRKVNGIGNSYTLNYDEFCVTNDDTHEIWQRNGENMRDFKRWYAACDFSSTSKLTGTYPHYNYR
jgi:hypothetical protein